MRQIVLDTETTGLSTKNGDRIVEIGCVEIINRNITGKFFHSYCNPERLVGSVAMSITGITDQFLLDKPKFAEIVEDFLQFVGTSELVIHNASFDVEFINNELKLLNHSIADLSLEFKIIDTLVLARKMHPGQRNNLDALCKRYNINNIDRELHGALKDANILAKLILKMTAGQINLDFNLSDNIKAIVKFGVKSEIKNIDKNHKLKIVYANQIEQQLHETYLLELLKL
ncbi:MAG: DNA polymerase III subunit epsilon [Gammaproteobacteria bacterium]